MNDLLLDTHAFLWFVNDDRRLPRSIETRLEARDTRVFLSMASAWEIAVKHGKGRLDLALPFEEFVFLAPARRGIEILPIEPRHIVRYDALGFPDPSHLDPFDRMLAAQALADRLTLVSWDAKLGGYGVSRLWDDSPSS